MNGVLMLSMESGMLLYSQELRPSFGLSQSCDPYQQSGFLYALYSSASAQFGSEKQKDTTSTTPPCHCNVVAPLQWFTQDHVVWYFHEMCQCPIQTQHTQTPLEQSSDEGNLAPVSLPMCTRRVLTALSVSETITSASAQAMAAKLSQVS